MTEEQEQAIAKEVRIKIIGKSTVEQITEYLCELNNLQEEMQNQIGISEKKVNG